MASPPRSRRSPPLPPTRPRAARLRAGGPAPRAPTRPMRPPHRGRAAPRAHAAGALGMTIRLAAGAGRARPGRASLLLAHLEATQAEALQGREQHELGDR